MLALKLAKMFEKKVMENEEHPDHYLDPDVVVEEHEGVSPVSYMACSNLKNIVHDATELLSIMNEDDDLPQWTDELLAVAKHNINKALSYVRSEKTIVDSEDEEEDELAELEKDVKLISEAGFFSSVKDFFKKPTEDSGNLKDVNSKLQRIFKSYGPKKMSLSEYANLAKEALKDNRFQDVRKYLRIFNEALNEMLKISLELDLGVQKQAGFFDFFKSKKPELTESYQGVSDPKIVALLKRELFLTVRHAESAADALKFVLNELDGIARKQDVNEYVARLEELKEIQETFARKFEEAQTDSFIYLPEGEESISGKFKEMSQDFGKENYPVAAKIGPAGSLFDEPFASEQPSPSSMSIEKTFKDKPFYDVSIDESKQSDFFNKFLGENIALPRPSYLLDIEPASHSIDPTEKCPCRSGALWLHCHGKDMDKIQEWMDKKGITLEESERRYYNWIEMEVAELLKQRSEQRKQQYINMIETMNRHGVPYYEESEGQVA